MLFYGASFWEFDPVMGRKDRKAKDARKKKKASVVACGRAVGIVDGALDGLVARQGERLVMFKQATDNVASRWDGISMSVADRMEQSCPMCGAETLWECKCVEEEERERMEESTGAKTDWSMVEIDTAMKSMAVQTPIQQQPKQFDEAISCESIKRERSTVSEGRVLNMDSPVKPQ
jgi:predicted RNA-binding Zn-ribbon protein involved in translation (DUF1610 family)